MNRKVWTPDEIDWACSYLLKKIGDGSWLLATDDVDVSSELDFLSQVPGPEAFGRWVDTSLNDRSRERLLTALRQWRLRQNKKDEPDAKTLEEMVYELITALLDQPPKVRVDVCLVIAKQADALDALKLKLAPAPVKPPERACQGCGVDLASKASNAKFCSDDCKEKWWKEKHGRACKGCGCDISGKDRRSKFCDKNCRAKWHNDLKSKAA